MANHTAGLPLHYQFFYEDEPYRRPAMDETIRRYGNLVTAPGERFQYSNLGYGLLDYVTERLSGKGYADFMRQEVFLPLGLTRASVGVGPGLEPYAATRYGGGGMAVVEVLDPGLGHAWPDWDVMALAGELFERD